MTKNYLWITFLMMAGTVGAGTFALPFLFHEAGWLAGLLFLGMFAAALAFVHALYLETLERHPGHALGGLTEKYFGSWGRLLSWVAVTGGLLFTLVAYLVLGAQFMAFLAPPLGAWGGVLFWVLSSLPFIVSLKRFVGAEVLGAALMMAVTLFIFVAAIVGGFEVSIPAVTGNGMFLLFGATLFALAGWCTVEQGLLYGQRERVSKAKIASGLAFGTGLSALLYLLFALGILGSASMIVPNALEGLSDWPFWRLAILLIFGLFAIWTSYVPIGLEIKRSLVSDSKWKPALANAFVILLPPLLVTIGFDNFLNLVGFVGGLFLSVQYLLIIFIAKKALLLRGARAVLANVLAAVFLLGALYEVYYFLLS